MPGDGSQQGTDIGPDDETAPLPVILADSAAPAGERTRGPFEPIARTAAVSEPPAAPASAVSEASAPPPAAVRQPPAASTSTAKLDQIKDLYLTAEAIGEDALAQHFQQVSDRQRQLIQQYFDRTATDKRAAPG